MVCVMKWPLGVVNCKFQGPNVQLPKAAWGAGTTGGNICSGIILHHFVNFPFTWPGVKMMFQGNNHTNIPAAVFYDGYPEPNCLASHAVLNHSITNIVSLSQPQTTCSILTPSLWTRSYEFSGIICFPSTSQFLVNLQGSSSS